MASQHSNHVTVIDTTTNAVVGVPILVGSGPFGVGIGP
jgi:YVTN family beta-propeller protein